MDAAGDPLAGGIDPGERNETVGIGRCLHVRSIAAAATRPMGPPTWIHQRTTATTAAGPRPRDMDTLLLGLLVAIKVAVTVLALYPLVDRRASHFAGKAMGVRAVAYPLAMLAIPMAWLAAGRPEPYPLLADLAFGVPFLLDSVGNVFGLFAIDGFDRIPHAGGWFALAIAFGLAVSPLLDERWVGFALVVGFAATVDVLWEVGEYLLMRSGASGLDLTYENTIQDLAFSLAGGVVAAVLVATLLWPAPGTPQAPFGWSLPSADAAWADAPVRVVADAPARR